MDNKTKMIDALKKIRLVCHFLPLVVTVMFILGFTVDMPRFIENCIMVPLLFVGWAAALIARPVPVLMMPVKLIGGAVVLGFNIVPVIPVCFILAAIGFALGLWLSLALLVFAPGVITVVCYVREKMEQPRIAENYV